MTSQAGMSLVTFFLNGQLFALDLEPVQEAVPLPEITPLGDASSAEVGEVKGIFNLRGTLVPVVDVKAQLGLPSGPYRLSQSVLITRRYQQPFGLIVDALGSVVSLSQEDVAVPPEVSYGYPKRLVNGVGKLPEDLVVILNLEELLKDFDETLIGEEDASQVTLA